MGVLFVHPRDSNHKLNWQVSHRTSATIHTAPISFSALAFRAGFTLIAKPLKKFTLVASASLAVSAQDGTSDEV